MVDQTPAMSQTIFDIVLPVSIIGLAAILVTYSWAKRGALHSHHFTVRSKLMTRGIFLCFLLSSTLVLGVLSAASATTTRGAAIWGARSSKAVNDINDPDSFSWRKTDGEVLLQGWIADHIRMCFSNNGYSAVNHQGEMSTKNQILYDVNNYYGYASSFDYFAVVDFDHGVGNDIVSNERHYMFEDDAGTFWGTINNYTRHLDEAAYDMEIYNRVNPDKTIFAFINTCTSADYNNAHGVIPYTDTYASYAQGMLPSGNARGMPFAFTHRLVHDKSSYPGFSITADPNDPRFGDISDDGYGDPDTGRNVYLGFPWGSAAIEQRIPFDYGPQYYYWLSDFFSLALDWDYSVNQALDIASDWTWGCGTFGSSYLHTGFAANWPQKDVNGNWQNSNIIGAGSTLAVYGNGDIHLKQYEPNYVSWPVISGPAVGDMGETYDFWARSTSHSGQPIHYVFDWGDGSDPEYTDYWPSGNWVGASHAWSANGIYTITVTAQDYDGTWSNPNYYTINIGNQPVYHYLTVEAYSMLIGTGFPLYPHVLIDSVDYGTAPVTVYVQEGWHDVELDYSVWNSYINCDTYFDHVTYDDGYNYYGYGSPVPVYHNQYATAWYYP